MEIESRVGRQIRDIFDFIVGTSTGGIIAMQIRLGYSVHEILKNYHEMAGNIEHHRNTSHRIPFLGHFFGPLWGPAFSQEGLFDTFLSRAKKEQGAEAPPTKLEHIQGPPYIAMVATDLGDAKGKKRASTVLFRNYETPSQYSTVDTGPIIDGLRATAAAPTKFAPLNIAVEDNRGKDEQMYVDGGLSANNPSVLGLIEARQLFGSDVPLHVISVGTGWPSKKPGSWIGGLLGKITKGVTPAIATEAGRVIKYMFEAQDENADSMMRFWSRPRNSLMGEIEYEYLNDSVSDADFMDARNMKTWQDEARKSVAENGRLHAKFERVCTLLQPQH